MILLFGLSLPTFAATLVVDPSDPTAYGSIGEAISAASSGDTLSIAAATYAECLNTAGKSLTLRGDGDAVIDSTGCGYALTVYSGESVTVADLSLTGGRGLYVAYSAVTLERVNASGLGDEGAYGGAIESYTSTLKMEDCLFEDDVAAYGGAAFLAWSNSLSDSGSTWRGNTASGGGGALYTYGYDVLAFDGVTVEDNSSPAGGGAFLINWDSGFSVQDSVFSGNSSDGSGGAIYLYAVDPTASISGSTFRDNQAAGNGGALELEWYTELSIADSQFIDNDAASWGGALFTYVLDSIEVRRSLFCANRAGYGGALGIQWTTADSLYNSQLMSNEAIQGGAIYRYGSPSGVLQNNTLAGNGSSDWGGAYYAGYYAYAAFSNNLIVDSHVGAGVYADYSYDYSYSTLGYDGWYGNDPVDAGGYFYVVDGGGGNLLGDPLLVSWTEDGDCSSEDLRLATGSPMRDAGDPAILDPDGSRSDIGAWGGPGAPVEDRDGDGLDTTQDCDDTNPDIGLGAVEICDGVDDDCDGVVDGEGAVDAQTWYTDWDGDGYGDDATAVLGCDAPEGAVVVGGDCDDINPYQSPGAEDVCDDGFDQDCSGADADCDTGQPETPDDSGEGTVKEAGGCGCGSAGPGGLWTAALALLALGRRRSRGA